MTHEYSNRHTNRPKLLRRPYLYVYEFATKGLLFVDKFMSFILVTVRRQMLKRMA